MTSTVSTAGIAGRLAVDTSTHSHVSEVAPVDTDTTGVSLFTITLKNGQRFRVTVEETD